MHPEIFVFGSNLAGRHGKGAALDAVRRHGAIYGQGFGRQGNAYAIPTKDKHLRPLPVEAVRAYVGQFLAYAQDHPDLRFYVTRIGCGLAHFKPAEIAPLFLGAPANCTMPLDFHVILHPLEKGRDHGRICHG